MKIATEITISKSEGYNNVTVAAAKLEFEASDGTPLRELNRLVTKAVDEVASRVESQLADRDEEQRIAAADPEAVL